MATFTATIINTMNIFGIDPTSKWNDLIWGTGLWAENRDIVTKTSKVLSGGLSFSDQTLKSSVKVLSATLTFSSDVTTMVQTDGNGYKYIFRGNTTNGNDQILDSSSSTVEGASTYSSTVNQATTWTDK